MSQEDRVPDTPDGRINDWLKGWDQGHWDFTFTEPGQNLAKYFEKVTDGRKGMKVLVPLCATTFDLIWFCERGHTVVGADLAESAAQRIFKQYKQKPIIEDVPSMNGKLYKNASGNFKFYVGNFFRFNEYMKAVRGVMGPKCITMLEFPKKGGSGAPYHFSEGQLKELYGDICDVEYLDEYVYDFSEAHGGDADKDAMPQDFTEYDAKVCLQTYCLRKRN
ncbi:thiopurine S-methyltransferase-like isoform X2 [Haliotis rubra]|uniref:thiopurine S-methyltransferase-like isoform X1 n=1 Tax=Haliotis rubra TaxID=36100 RepID=UPI001EE53BED|nr:thiopurine S-methyltransferase-like isoform X1 [Haliotis rubra]XP_046566931.1 thiopurine S-methyltransferase-like isoform X2 [Haliotis rubra]